MKAVYILFLVLPLVILGCGSIDIGGDCFYYEQWPSKEVRKGVPPGGLPIKEVTDSLGDVYEVEIVEVGVEEVEILDDREFCGVSRRATPKQVGDKKFFTFNGVDIEAEAVEQITWRLVMVRIE